MSVILSTWASWATLAGAEPSTHQSLTGDAQLNLPTGKLESTFRVKLDEKMNQPCYAFVEDFGTKSSRTLALPRDPFLAPHRPRPLAHHHFTLRVRRVCTVAHGKSCRDVSLEQLAGASKRILGVPMAILPPQTPPHKAPATST